MQWLGLIFGVLLFVAAVYYFLAGFFPESGVGQRMRARLEIRYQGLRNANEARISGAGAGNVIGSSRPDVILGSPGANRAYVIP